jgi:hypothetical protein
MFCPRNSLAAAPIADVCIEHDMGLLEISEEVVNSTLTVVSTAASKVLLTFSTLQLHNPNVIVIERLQGPDVISKRNQLQLLLQPSVTHLVLIDGFLWNQ